MKAVKLRFKPNWIERLGRDHDSKNIDLDSCIPLGLGHFRRYVAVASGVFEKENYAMLTFLFWLVMTPLVLYMALVALLAVIVECFKK